MMRQRRFGKVLLLVVNLGIAQSARAEKVSDLMNLDHLPPWGGLIKSGAEPNHSVYIHCRKAIREICHKPVFVVTTDERFSVYDATSPFWQSRLQPRDMVNDKKPHEVIYGTARDALKDASGDLDARRLPLGILGAVVDTAILPAEILVAGAWRIALCMQSRRARAYILFVFNSDARGEVLEPFTLNAYETFAGFVAKNGSPELTYEEFLAH